mmetsp:Transcript_38438/g.151745  ORF Transcript_38438/g.151745 Transcript_38438/m.151745 type:complete len:172 (+) Transcript_38438:755-1270(+)
MNTWIKFFKESPLVETTPPCFKLVEHYKKLLITEKTYLYIVYSKNINLHELENLCKLVGWVKRPPQKVKYAINSSFLNLTLYVGKTNTLIGFVRAISDTTFNATIWDMVIHPDYQKQGLGTILMKEVIQELRYLEIDTVTLFADAKNIRFYNKLGFIIDPYNIKGMFWYPK